MRCSFSEKYTKDLVVTKRKLGEAEQKVQQLEAKLKAVMKEKEVAVFALAQSKVAGSHKEGQRKATQEARQDEMAELRARCAFSAPASPSDELTVPHLFFICLICW